MSLDKISKTAYFQLYIIEIWTIAKTIIELSDKLFNCQPYMVITSKPENNILDPSSEPHEIISSVLTHAARLHKLFQSSNKREGEEESEFEFRKQRSKHLRQLLLPKKKQSHEIFKTGVRNGMEHFDERVDLMNTKIINRDENLIFKTLLYNVTLSSKRVFVDWHNVIPFKVYIVDTGDYIMVDYNFEPQSVSIYEIFEEVKKVLENCKKWAKGIPDTKGNVLNNPVGILKTGPHLV